MKTQTNEKTNGSGTLLQVTQWFEDAPFTVEVKQRSQPANRSSVKRNHYVKLGIRLFSHRPPGSVAGLRRNRRHGRMDRKGALRAVSGAVSRFADPGAEAKRETAPETARRAP